jgi:hypothetical protein
MHKLYIYTVYFYLVIINLMVGPLFWLDGQ